MFEGEKPAMKKCQLTPDRISAFIRHLKAAEHSEGTIQKYQRDIQAFAHWLGEKPMTKEAAAGWKEYLTERQYCPATINSMLAAINAYFNFSGRPELRVNYLRIQKRMFRSEKRELTRLEYTRLLEAAARLGRERLVLLMEAICATGIRVSELQYITVEAARSGQTEISLKGKIRTILLPGKLCRKLLRYAKKQNISSGAVFRTRSGGLLSRKQIWAEMKSLCVSAGVTPTKVFPHNLRHLFARMFYKAAKDVAKLADVLGHSSIETTRIYLISTGAEHVRYLDQLGLVN